MTDMTKWEGERMLKPEEEGEYLKDFCKYLREQHTLGEVRKEGEASVCDIVPDEVAAHAADIIEELWGRLQKEYWDGVSKGMEVKADQYAYEISKGVSKPE
jgi:hypothetical protein